MENDRRIPAGVAAGVDVGGTFTDLILAEGGRVRVAKVPTVPEDPAAGVLAALAAAGVALENISTS